jgi:hypothetical protein
MTALAVLEAEPIQIDPRLCELCGLAIDQHVRVDTPGGTESFCEDIEELERRAESKTQKEVADIVRRWELADPRDRWKHNSEARPKASAPPEPSPWSYRTPQATIDAFKFVVRLDDIARLRTWLSDHPKDAPYLLSLLEGQDNA